MDDSVDVIAMGVGQDDLSDVIECKARSRQCSRELLCAIDLHARERHVARRCGLAGVDESQNSLVLDRPAVDRQRLREWAGREQVELASSAAAREEEAVLDAHGSGREGVDLHEERPSPSVPLGRNQTMVVRLDLCARRL